MRCKDEAGKVGAKGDLLTRVCDTGIDKVCDMFQADPTVNPVTGRNITETGPLHKFYTELCNNHSEIQAAKNKKSRSKSASASAKASASSNATATASSKYKASVPDKQANTKNTKNTSSTQTSPMKFTSPVKPKSKAKTTKTTKATKATKANKSMPVVDDEPETETESESNLEKNPINLLNQHRRRQSQSNLGKSQVKKW